MNLVSMDPENMINYDLYYVSIFRSQGLGPLIIVWIMGIDIDGRVMFFKENYI